MRGLSIDRWRSRTRVSRERLGRLDALIGDMATHGLSVHTGASI